MSAQPLKVIAGTPDRPLMIGDIEIPCYVLEGEIRALSQRGFLRAIGRTGRAPTSPKRGDVYNLPVFLSQKNLKPFISNDLVMTTTPVLFKSPRGGRVAYGYCAELLPGVCEVYLAAREARALLPSQKHIAERAEILTRGLAHVAITALVDEATGYQAVRRRRALEVILEKYLRSYQSRWAKRFPDDFYMEIFRLRGWEWQGMQVNRPQAIAQYTNDIIYRRIAPGLLSELQHLNPITESGERKHKHHQWLTDDFGQPDLYTHLHGVMAIMRTVRHSNPKRAWDEFMRRLQRAYPKKNTNFDLDFDE